MAVAQLKSGSKQDFYTYTDELIQDLRNQVPDTRAVWALTAISNGRSPQSVLEALTYENGKKVPELAVKWRKFSLDRLSNDSSVIVHDNVVDKPVTEASTTVEDKSGENIVHYPSGNSALDGLDDDGNKGDFITDVVETSVMDVPVIADDVQLEPEVADNDKGLDIPVQLRKVEIDDDNIPTPAIATSVAKLSVWQRIDAGADKVVNGLVMVNDAIASVTVNPVVNGSKKIAALVKPSKAETTEIVEMSAERQAIAATGVVATVKGIYKDFRDGFPNPVDAAKDAWALTKGNIHYAVMVGREKLGAAIAGRKIESDVLAADVRYGAEEVFAAVEANLENADLGGAISTEEVIDVMTGRIEVLTVDAGVLSSLSDSTKQVSGMLTVDDKQLQDLANHFNNK